MTRTAGTGGRNGRPVGGAGYGRPMATWDDVRAIALALPETEERTSRGQLEWRARDKGIAWERPLRKADREALGDAAPQGPILGAHVPDEGVKFALCAEQPDVFFTTPHFNGYPAVLVQLDHIPRADLEELITESWLAKVPKRLARQFLAERSAAGGAGAPDG